MFLGKLLLWINGLAFCATGFIGFFGSSNFAAFIGYALLSGAAQTEFVANYGGLYLFYGFYLCWCGTAFERSVQGIAVLCFTSLGFFTGRIFGSIITAEIDATQLVFASWELITALLALVLLFKLKSH